MIDSGDSMAGTNEDIQYLKDCRKNMVKRKVLHSEPEKKKCLSTKYVRMIGGTISLTIPKLKNMEEGLMSPH